MKTKLVALATELKTYTHLDSSLTQLESAEGIDAEAGSRWEELGRPCLWVVGEEKNGYTCLVDHGYGHLALFCGDELMYVTLGHQIAMKGVVALDVDYYEVDDYLYFS